MAKHSITEIDRSELSSVALSDPSGAEEQMCAWARDLLANRWAPDSIAVSFRENGLDCEWEVAQLKKIIEDQRIRPSTRLKAMTLIGQLRDRGLQDLAVDGRRASAPPGQIGLPRKKAARMTEEDRLLAKDGAEYVAEVNAVDRD